MMPPPARAKGRRRPGCGHLIQGQSRQAARSSSEGPPPSSCSVGAAGSSRPSSCRAAGRVLLAWERGLSCSKAARRRNHLLASAINAWHQSKAQLFVRAVADLNPVAQFTQTSENIELVLDEVRPYLMADGGNVAFHEIDRNVVRLMLQGACGSCLISVTTMKMGIQWHKYDEL
ncbi:hypothetical protein EJB05_50565 [Eragrostis curvula]|uniref:NIF system FeS cluster assembly NifU C-terminal domain-containing protein n=1 Tax=Eragrostis curvula TaxID=38414 RepID=A0A5J9SY50_9POAL|nr:hypothetical protein EJB05_50565 [Eragrostis curvula]